MERTASRVTDSLEARELIEYAERHPYGTAFLVEAPFENAALLFGVHPFTVLEARKLLSSRPPSA